MIWHERLGLSANEIVTEYELSLADVYGLLAFYFDHREKIDRTIREDEEFVAELRRQTPSLQREKIGG